MRDTQYGEFRVEGGPGALAIGRDSDPRMVREMRDACQRWLDEKANEDAAQAAMVPDLMSHLTGIDRDRLTYLRRELEIAEREAAREPLDVSFLPADQRVPFESANAETAAARDAIPRLRAEIAELERRS
jgi:hypothetical protein